MVEKEEYAMNREIEKSIIKKFRKEIWSKFIKAIKDYKLVNENDSIAVCISGGKDSFLLAKCLEELQKHKQIPFEIKYIIMNPGYSNKNIEKIKDNLLKLNINAHIFDVSIFDYVDKTNNPCYLCARMRRGYLYSKAKELGCNKIALGHHFNDVVETVLLNMVYNGQYATMMPKLHSDHFEGMELIRPLYYVKEIDIIKWTQYNKLSFIDCACKVTEKKSNKREMIKTIINELDNMYDCATKNIMTSTSNVNLNQIIGYYQEDEIVNFLDHYELKNRNINKQ